MSDWKLYSKKLNFKISHSGLSGILMFLVFFLLSCEEKPEGSDSDVIARVGAQQLSLEEALAFSPLSAVLEDSAAAIQAFRLQWIREQVLVEEAYRQRVDESASFTTAVESFKRQLLVQLLLDKHLNELGEPEVSREQAMRYYEQHRDQFILDERFVRFHHMIAPTMEEAVAARNDLLRGVEWNTIVEAYSLEPEQAIRNSTLFQPISTTFKDKPAIAQFLGVIGVSEVSPIRNINGRYHFVQLLENQASGSVPELDWALAQIEEWIGIEQKRIQINAFQQNLIRQAEANRSIRLHE